jgi:flagellar basal-body rod modification protein FlgD
MSTSSITSAASTSASSSTSTTTDAFQALDLEEFLKLLVTELQNQDPLEPMKNSEILQQLSQIKAIESNERLSDTLTSLQLQQSLSTGSNLLQKNVTGLSDDGEMITGQVDSISIEDDSIKVHIGDQSISIKNITDIQSAE